MVNPIDPATGKRKRGRPKKVKLPEEIQEKIENAINNTKQKEQDEYHQIVEEAKKKYRTEFEWDFKKEDYIPFFDSRLSYELSGYRPIDDKRGLDFDPKWFTEARDTYDKTGKYCSFAIGSKLYRDF